jgi:hypothetical protein
LVVHYDDTWGAAQTVSGTSNLYSVTGSGSDVWACGWNSSYVGVVVHYDGIWRAPQAISGTNILDHVTGPGSDAWACGQDSSGTTGVVVHYASVPPTITTTAVTSITSTTASSGGNTITDGGASITHKGVCWSTSPNPTTTDPKTDNGTGTSDFSSSITGLSPGTAYHVRAYATNSVDTSYGDDIPFTTKL